MKRLFLLLFLLVFGKFLFGQAKNLYIEYQVFYNTDLPNVQTANLYIDFKQNKSVYIKNNPNDKKEQAYKAEEGLVNVKFKSKTPGVNFFNFENDSLYSTENIFGEAYLIKEKIPEMKWVLNDEEKEIDHHKVYKATCYFRGRNYIAWYSTDYPFRFGPWKFNGLPGLIFEVYDETKRFHWLIKNISYEDNHPLSMPDTTDLIPISIFEYPKIKYDVSGFNEKLLSRLPRKAKIENQEISKNGFEIKFEWEN